MAVEQVGGTETEPSHDSWAEVVDDNVDVADQPLTMAMRLRAGVRSTSTERLFRLSSLKIGESSVPS